MEGDAKEIVFQERRQSHRDIQLFALVCSTSPDPSFDFLAESYSVDHFNPLLPPSTRPRDQLLEGFVPFVAVLAPFMPLTVV